VISFDRYDAAPPIPSFNEENADFHKMPRCSCTLFSELAGLYCVSICYHKHRKSECKTSMTASGAGASGAGARKECLGGSIWCCPFLINPIDLPAQERPQQVHQKQKGALKPSLEGMCQAGLKQSWL
jgi:hypothetical protein